MTRTSTIPLFLVLWLIAISMYAQPVVQVNPLLKTKWNQGCFYNDLCPPVPSGGSCGKSWAGCVPTAMAQVLKYYAYPASGYGTKAFSYPAGTTVDFSALSFNWTAMPNMPNATNTDLARLFYYSGGAVDVLYGSSGSSAFTASIIFALTRYFKYSLSANYAWAGNYSVGDWEQKIKDELIAGRPVVYANLRHAFVLDGFKNGNQFHINWGWGGAFDGYYTLNQLSPLGMFNGIANTGEALFGLQPGASLEVSPQAVSFSGVNTGRLIEVISENAWSISNLPAWVTASTTTGIAGFSRILLQAAPNTAFTARTATINVVNGNTSKAITIFQERVPPLLRPSTQSINFAATPAGLEVLTITSDSTFTVGITDNWLGTTLTGNVLKIGAIRNVDVNSRSAQIILTRGRLISIINASQGSTLSPWCVPALSTIPGSGGVSDGKKDNGITLVRLKSINRASTIINDYIYYSSDSTILKKDSVYLLRVGLEQSTYARPYIDWNRDGDFTDVGEQLVSDRDWQSTFPGITRNLLVTVPSYALPGKTRLRIYSDGQPIISPCSAINVVNPDNLGGEVEDYPIIIADPIVFNVSTAGLNFTTTGGSKPFTINANVSWTVSGVSASWFSVSGTNQGSGNATLAIVAAPNNTLQARSGSVLVRAGGRARTLLVQQSAAIPTLSLLALDSLYDARDAFGYILVNANTPWTITGTTTGIILDKFAGDGGLDTVRFALSANAAASQRIFSIPFSYASLQKSVNVRQIGRSITLEVSPATLNVGRESTSNRVSIFTNSDWSVTSNQIWIMVNVTSGTNLGAVQIVIAPNTTGASRDGQITITAGGITRTINIVQDTTTTQQVDVDDEVSVIIVTSVTGTPPSSVTGIANPDNGRIFKAYPIPNNGTFFIDGLKAADKIEIFTSEGIKLPSSAWTRKDNAFTLTNPDVGLYLIRINEINQPLKLLIK